MLKSLYLLSLITMVTVKTTIPTDTIINNKNTETLSIIKYTKTQVNLKENLQQFLTELFTKDGRKPTDVEFVDDDSEKMLTKYGFFFQIFTFLFILMAIHSLFFHNKK